MTKLDVDTVCAINELVFARIDEHRRLAREWGTALEEDGFANFYLAEKELTKADALAMWADELRELVKGQIYFNGKKWVKENRAWLIKRKK